MCSWQGELSRKFKVSGIPTLVFIDGQSGKLITMDGRKIVSEDPRGENFPWKPKPLQELLGTEFINNSGETVPASALDGKVVGLYFSAHWVSVSVVALKCYFLFWLHCCTLLVEVLIHRFTSLAMLHRVWMAFFGDRPSTLTVRVDVDLFSRVHTSYTWIKFSL